MSVETIIIPDRVLMGLPSETSDSAILDLLRQAGSMGIAELASATQVTPTAVRQRLNRMMGQGLIDRRATRAARGRPSHRYSLTEKGERQTGTNFTDLALVLWEEVRSIPDPAIRRGLLARIAKQMAGLYADRIHGTTASERMHEVAGVFAERNVPFVVEEGPFVVEEGNAGEGNAAAGQLPVLTALACPYPQLAEQDRGICALERMMLTELLERNVKLSACRLDGDSCCRFQTN
jgi:DeoR family transcriptional regulator, suf operon transcriptional repressor